MLLWSCTSVRQKLFAICYRHLSLVGLGCYQRGCLANNWSCASSGRSLAWISSRFRVCVGCCAIRMPSSLEVLRKIFTSDWQQLRNSRFCVEASGSKDNLKRSKIILLDAKAFLLQINHLWSPSFAATLLLSTPTCLHKKVALLRINRFSAAVSLNNKNRSALQHG